MVPSTDKDHLSWYVLEREPVSLIVNLLFIYSDGGGVDSITSDSVTMVTLRLSRCSRRLVELY